MRVRRRVLGLVLLVLGSMTGGTADAQFTKGDVGTAIHPCAQQQGGTQTGGSFFQTCISNHGNVVTYNFGVPGTFGHCCVGNSIFREGYFVFFNEDAVGFQCWWDNGESQFVGGGGRTWVDNFAGLTSPANYRVTRSHDQGLWSLEQNFGVDEFSKIQKIVMLIRNQAPFEITGVRMGRYGDIDASQNTTNVVLNSDINTSVIAVEENGGTTGSGLELFPRSYRAEPRTAVEKSVNWSLESCTPATPETASPTVPGDYAIWGWNELGRIFAGGSKLVVFEYRAV